MLDAGQGRCAGAAVVAGDEHDVGMRLRHAGRNGADPHLGHQLDVDPGLRVRVLQVVDQLREVLDRIDVVVRRRRDEADARRRVAHLRNPGVHLEAGQLAPLARLRALRHLDLQVVGVHQVLAGHAEPAGGDLLDRAPPEVAVYIRDVARRILASLAGVRLAAQAVHRNGERLVRLGADRAVRHRAGGEAPEDRLGRLHVVDRDRLSGWPEIEQAPQRRPLPVLIVHEGGVLPVNPLLAAARRMLQLEHRLRVEQVVLAVAPPLVLATRLQLVVLAAAAGERLTVAADHLLGHHVDADAADARRGPGEAGVDELLVKADRLEDLRAAIALQRRRSPSSTSPSARPSCTP